MVVYGLQPKEETLDKVKRFITDMSVVGAPKCLRMDNGGNLTSALFTIFYDRASICREYTAPDTPKQNADAESAIWRVMKVGPAACLEVPRATSFSEGKFPRENLRLPPRFLGIWTVCCWKLQRGMQAGSITPLLPSIQGRCLSTTYSPGSHRRIKLCFVSILHAAREPLLQGRFVVRLVSLPE